MVLGALAGWAMSALIVPVLVSAAVPGSHQPTLAINPLIVGIVAGAIGIAFIVAALVMSTMVRKHAISTRTAEAAE